jgi:MFS family permease
MSSQTTGAVQRLATRIVFFIAGYVTATWAVLVPYAKANTGVNEATLGSLLLCLGMGALVAMPLTGMLTSRYGWAACFGPAPFLPMSREEMDQLGWDSCDIILVTGDAYVDHPSFGMAICGRMLEAQGFRVGIISQPDWNSKDDFMRLGKPNLFFGVTAGNLGKRRW